MVSEIHDKHILDTSAWNHLFDDPKRKTILQGLRSTVVLPTCVAISELAAIEDHGRRLRLLRLVKSLGKDNRPLATPNEIIIMACQGYSRRDRVITLNAGNDSTGAWIALNDPALVDAEAQRVALEFNKEREKVLRDFQEGLRTNLQELFENGVARPPSMGAVIIGSSNLSSRPSSLNIERKVSRSVFVSSPD